MQDSSIGVGFSQRSIVNWSGGKDSTLTLYKILQSEQYEVVSLFTTISNKLRRITMHGVREELLDQQALVLGLPLTKLELPTSDTMDLYNQLMQEQMEKFIQKGVESSIFGDIHLEDLKLYREQQLAKVGLKGVFPIWKMSVTDVLKEFLDAGFKAIVVCVNARYLDQSFVGRILDEQFIADLPEEVDICGENGEFHSFVFDGPIFKKPINFELGEVVYKDYSNGKENLGYDTGFYFIDLIPI